MNTTINFGGFYHSHHEYIIERAVAFAIDADDPDTGEIDHDKLFDFNEWQTVQIEYCKAWLNMLNSELDTNIKFVALDSPRFYNFQTDVIVADVSRADAIKVLAYVKSDGAKDILKRIIRDRTTSYDGYHAFYKYGDIFDRENRDLLIQMAIDAIIERQEESYPFICEDFYC